MEKKWLLKLQQTELDILKNIDMVCKKNNIRYFVMYGTLLGTVRHKGFIPWDDDIDIGMPREDFEKFIKIANDELNDKYKLDYFNTNKKYCLPFAKVRNINTSFNEELFAEYDGNKGIYVDVFPFDYVKHDHYTRIIKLKLKIANVLEGVVLYKTLKLPSSKKIKLLSKFLSNRFAGSLIKLVQHGSKKYNNLVIYSIGGVEYSQIYKKDSIFPLQKMTFCNFEVNVPNNCDDILTIRYGSDYMVPPPISKRIMHHPTLIKFEDGEEKHFDSKE